MYEPTMVDNAVRLAISKNVYIVLLGDPKVVNEAEIWSVLDVVLPAVIIRNFNFVFLRSSEVVHMYESAIDVHLVLLAVIANDMNRVLLGVMHMYEPTVVVHNVLLAIIANDVDSVLLSCWLVVDEAHFVVVALLHSGLQALEHASVRVLVVDGHLVGLRY
jgi:hypothetical protein